MKTLNLSPDLKLTLDIAGEAIGILATRGAGKSYTSASLIEELWASGIQFAVLDPTGVYWGLRAAANGKDPGLPIIVLGGIHGDVPLESTAGSLIADLLVDTGQSLVLDMSDFPTKAAQTKFITEFSERLYRRKAKHRTTIHLIIDEADEFAPQRPMRDEARMLHHMETMVRRGRSRGIGVTLITQRSATLNKNVLNLIDTLISMRITGPNDRKVVESWMTAKALQDEAGLVESIPKLPTGTGWVWSPVRDILKQVKFRTIQTFDSYATPKPGQQKIEPSKLAEIDINALGEQIKATAERAKENNPKELKAKVRELEKQLAQGKSTVNPGVAQKIIVKKTEIREVLKEIIKERYDTAIPKICALVVNQLKDIRTTIETAEQEISNEMHRILDQEVYQHNHGEDDVFNEAHKRLTTPKPETPPIYTKPRPVRQNIHKIEPIQHTNNNENDLSKVGLRILDAMAELEALGIGKAPRVQIAMFSGYTNIMSKGFANSISQLRTAGYIDYPDAGTASLTMEGRVFANLAIKPRTTQELQGRVMQMLGGSARRILEPLIRNYPDAMTKEELMEQAGYSNMMSKGFANTVSRLRTLKLIDYPERGYVVALPVLFLDN